MSQAPQALAVLAAIMCKLIGAVVEAKALCSPAHYGSCFRRGRLAEKDRRRPSSKGGSASITDETEDERRQSRQLESQDSRVQEVLPAGGRTAPAGPALLLPALSSGQLSCVQPVSCCMFGMLPGKLCCRHKWCCSQD